MVWAVLIAWSNEDLIFLFATLYEFFHSRECVLGGAAEDEAAIECIQKRGDELIAWVSSIEEQHTSSWNIGKQMPGFLPFGRIDIDHTSGYGKTS